MSSWITVKTKPAKKRAVQITNGSCTRLEGNKYSYAHDNGVAVFSAHQPPRYGDWIVEQSTDDVYLVPAEVFVEKYEFY